MSERKRMGIMIGMLVVLVAANVIFRMGGDGLSANLFSDETDLSDAYSTRAQRNMNVLDSLGDLTFVDGTRSVDEPGRDSRNPFIFGVDRRREQEAAARMAALQKLREEAASRAREEAAQQAAAPKESPEPAAVRFPGEVLGTMTDVDTGETRASIVIANEHYTAVAGMDLPGGFRVLSISESAVRLLYTKDNREVTIALQTRAR